MPEANVHFFQRKRENRHMFAPNLSPPSVFEENARNSGYYIFDSIPRDCIVKFFNFDFLTKWQPFKLRLPGIAWVNWPASAAPPGGRCVCFCVRARWSAVAPKLLGRFWWNLVVMTIRGSSCALERIGPLAPLGGRWPPRNRQNRYFSRLGLSC